MQIPLHTASSAETYIRNHEWRTAQLYHYRKVPTYGRPFPVPQTPGGPHPRALASRAWARAAAVAADTRVRSQNFLTLVLPGCPLHPSGGCSFARHGSYPRRTPRGMRIARWYCRQGHRTFSLLPDFLAARWPGLLDTIEDSVAAAGSAKSMEAAADRLRGPDITLPSAVRWLRRRVRAVRARRRRPHRAELFPGTGPAASLPGPRRPGRYSSAARLPGGLAGRANRPWQPTGGGA